MKVRPRIVVFGSVHMDLIAHSTQLPATGESGLAHGFSSGLGGKGANQAVECARAGADAIMLARLGKDTFGKQLFEALKSDGVDCSQVTLLDGVQTGVSTVLSAPSGYTSLIYPGASAAWTEADVAVALQAVGPFDMLLIQLELPISLSMQAARTALACGARVVLNASPPASSRLELDQLLELSDVLVVNETEALGLAGVATARDIAQQFNCLCVVTAGAKEVTASDGESVWGQAPTALEVTSTVGAGDAFLAGFCVSRGRGGEVAAALTSGTSAARQRLVRSL
jgi:ribokinase